MGIEVTRRVFSAGAVLGTLAASKGMAQAGTLAGGAAAQGASDVMTGLRSEYPIPALSAAVVRNGELVWTAALGLADLEQKTPAGTHHRFRLGSSSKVVTAAIGARLADAGKIDLDAPISTYRSNLPEAHRATTLRQLYSHQGGVRHYGASDYNPAAPGGLIDLRPYRNTEDALAIFIDDPLVAEPGTSVNYSTFGYTLISAVLESASGKSFIELIAEEVAAPLGLSELAADEPLKLIEGRVGFYDTPQTYAPLMPVPDAPLVNAFGINPAYKWAGGGMVGSARDVARFGAAHLADGYLKPATREMVFAPRTQAGPQMPALGLGWRIDSQATLGRRYHHAGSMQGCRAQIALYPDHGLSVALMSNLGATPGNILDYTDRIAESFKG